MLVSTVCDMEKMFEKLLNHSDVENDNLNKKEQKFLKIMDTPVEELVDEVSFDEIIEYINNFERYSVLFTEGETSKCRKRLWLNTKQSKLCPRIL